MKDPSLRYCGRNFTPEELDSIRLPSDWEMLYGYRPVLMETFVEINRFQGTCYKAANWIHVGQTKGRGKLANTPVLPIKDIWLYPLTPAFQNLLRQP